MSRKRQRPREGAAPAAPPPAPRPSPAIRLALFAMSAVALVAVFFVAGRGLVSGDVRLPPPVEMPPQATVVRADFVGAAQCAGCHQEEYATWTRSTHGRAGGAPSPARVLPAFDGRPIRFRDAVVTPRVLAGGQYAFIVEQGGRTPRTITVDGVIGGGHLAGGGTQGFVTRWADGTMRFVPFDYSRQAAAWFCNTNSRADRGWRVITADMPLASCGDWPPTRVLGDVRRFANCQGCHGSRIEAALDPATHRYQTSFASLSIDCESCHGPGRAHVALAASPGMASRADIGMRALATLDKDQSLRVCFQCHAVKDQLRPGFIPGDSLERHYSLGLPLLGDRALGPDGRVRTFAYQENQRYSECYRKGGMRCTDCHDPHSQGYRDVNGTALPGRSDDRQCTSCHASLADNPTAHTHHPVSSPGSRCVACHMPYLQHPEVGQTVRYARSDHTIPVPRPALDSALGVASACSTCHAATPAAALQRRVASWYGGTLKPLSPSVAAQVAVGTRLPSAAEARAMIADDGHAMAQVAGLARLVESLAAGSADWFDDALAERLRALASSANRDVAALALASLHLQRGDDRGTRRFLAAALRTAGAHDAALRDRWALVLGFVGDQRAAAAATPQAVDAYRKALEIRPGDARLVLSLANAERDGAADAPALSRAIADYADAVRLDPFNALALVNQGIALAAAGDTMGAVSSWQRAALAEPGEPLAPFNLGNVYLVRRQYAEAAAAYRRATALDESLAPAHFNLARALIAGGRSDAALDALTDGLRFDTTNTAAREMAALLGQRRAETRRVR